MLAKLTKLFILPIISKTNYYVSTLPKHHNLEILNLFKMHMFSFFQLSMTLLLHHCVGVITVISLEVMKKTYVFKCLRQS